MVNKAKRPASLFWPENQKNQSEEWKDKMEQHFRFESVKLAILAFCASAGLYKSRHCKWMAKLVEGVEGEINLVALYDESLVLALDEETEQSPQDAGLMRAITYQRTGSTEGLFWETGSSETEITLYVCTESDPELSEMFIRNKHSQAFGAEGGADPRGSFTRRVREAQKYAIS